MKNKDWTLVLKLAWSFQDKLIIGVVEVLSAVIRVTEEEMEAFVSQKITLYIRILLLRFRLGVV